MVAAQRGDSFARVVRYTFRPVDVGSTVVRVRLNYTDAAVTFVADFDAEGGLESEAFQERLDALVKKSREMNEAQGGSG